MEAFNYLNSSNFQLNSIINPKREKTHKSKEKSGERERVSEREMRGRRVDYFNPVGKCFFGGTDRGAKVATMPAITLTSFMPAITDVA